MKPAPRHDELRKQYEAEAVQNPKAYLHWQHRNNSDGARWHSCDSRPMWYENVEYRRKTIGHPHAALMAQYAQDATTHERPWELWEVKAKGDEIWYPLQVPARWCEDQDYRRKPHPKTNLQVARELLDSALDNLEAHSVEICEPNVDHIQNLIGAVKELLLEPKPEPVTHTVTLTTDQLKEVILACEFPSWENEDFTSAVLALRIALWGEV